MIVNQEEVELVSAATITLSVFVLTYNQSPYISQTLDSILSQQTDFRYEIVIGDDASTDGTSQICESYKSQFDKLIDYKRNEVNLGLIENFRTTAQRLKGKYVAICDGDDYWIDPFKLQKQVDFLENNADCAIVGTRMQNQIDQEIFTSHKWNENVKFSLAQMAIENRVAAPTVVFRNFNQLQRLPTYFKTFPYGDWPVYLMLLHQTNGYVIILPDITTVYRINIGVSAYMRGNLLMVLKKNTQILIALIDDPFMIKMNRDLIIGFIHQKRALIAALNKKKKFTAALKELLSLLKTDFKRTHVRFYLYSIHLLFQSPK